MPYKDPEQKKEYDRKRRAAAPPSSEKRLKYQREFRRERTRHNKSLVLKYYSDRNNPICACSGCNEKRTEFLCIDHINGGGTKHREQIKKSGATFYQWLINNNLPSGYQVLCHNCNQAYGFFGYCPHQYENLGAWWNK